MRNNPIAFALLATPLEVGALGDWEALQVAAKAVEAELDGAEAYPVASAIDARARRRDAPATAQSRSGILVRC
jgi:hypothetical protein